MLPIVLDYDFEVTLCVIYALGAVASIWGALFSPYRDQLLAAVTENGKRVSVLVDAPLVTDSGGKC